MFNEAFKRLRGLRRLTGATWLEHRLEPRLLLRLEPRLETRLEPRFEPRLKVIMKISRPLYYVVRRKRKKGGGRGCFMKFLKD